MSMFKTATKGMAWTTISTIIRSLVGLFQISILTRHLDVGDFGTIAIATVFIGFTQIFLDLGISAGIMHKQDATRDQLSSLFWLNILTGIVLTLILIAGAPLVALTYDDESLTPIIMLLSLSVFFAALGSQHRTIQHKEMRFKYMAIIEMIGSIVTMLVAVILAINGYGVYSLVFSTLAGRILSNLIYLILGLRKDNNVYWHFRLKETYPFLKIGVYSIGSRVLDYFSREIDIIFIGASFGKDVLGLYTLCKKIVQMLYGLINPIITKILTPLFAKIQSDKNKVVGVYFKLIETLSITNLPIYFFVAVFSKTVLFYLYGPEYVEGAFILSVIAMYYGILSLSNPVGSLQIAFGRTDLGFYWTIYRVLTTLLVVYIASFYNIETLVLLFLLLAIINTVVLWRFQIYIILQMDIKLYMSAMLKSFSIVVLIATPLFFMFWDVVSLLYAISTFIVGSIFYIFLTFKWQPKSYIIELLTNKYFKLLKS